MLRALILSLTVLASVSAHAADDNLYIKKGDSFVPVTKRDAVVEFLKDDKAPVFKCVEQRLTSKLNLKAKSSD